MKRATLAVLLIVIAAGSAAAQVQLGLRTGQHSIFDSTVRDVYGNGWIFVPYVRITSKRTHLAVEFSYEGG